MSLRNSLDLVNCWLPFWVSCCFAILPYWQENGKVTVVVGMFSFVNKSRNLQIIESTNTLLVLIHAVDTSFLAAVALCLFHKDILEIVVMTTFYPNILLSCLEIVGKVTEYKIGLELNI